MPVIKHKSAEVNLLCMSARKGAWIFNLHSKEKGKGHARELMKKINDMADVSGLPLRISAKPYLCESVSLHNLVKFYHSLGYKLLPPIMLAYTNKEEYVDMYREPVFRLTDERKVS